MKSLCDAWHLHRETMARLELDAIARREIERAFFAGAEYVVDGVQDLNDLGLVLPFAVTRQLTQWNSEVATHLLPGGFSNDWQTETPESATATQQATRAHTCARGEQARG